MEKLFFSYGMMIHRTLVWKRHTPKLMKWKKEVEMERFQMTPNSRDKGSLELRGLVWRRGRSSSLMTRFCTTTEMASQRLPTSPAPLAPPLAGSVQPFGSLLCQTLFASQKSSVEKILLYSGFSLSQAISSSAPLHAGISCGFMFA